MNELLKKYKIEEISKKTSISPMFLQKIAEEKFDKISKLKFNGFLKILKSEFPEIDFSDLEEKANSYYFIEDDTKKTGKQQIIEKLYKEEKNYKHYIFVVVLLLLIGILLYKMNLNSDNKEEHNTTVNLISIKNIEKNESNKIIANNIIKKSKKEVNKIEQNLIKIDNSAEKSIPVSIDTTLKIEPLKLVWFKVYYLDLNKSKEYLTSKEVDLNTTSKKIFIKFGHGMVKLYYNNKTFFPDRKSITRVIIENGEMNVTNKKVGSFK